MATTLYTQFEDCNEHRKYPFSVSSSLISAEGYELPQDFITDAVLYLYSRGCNLVRIHGTGVAGEAEVVIDADDDNLVGTFGTESDFVDIHDSFGVYRGTLVLGSSAKDVAIDPSDRNFEHLSFASSCLVVLGKEFVTGLSVNGSKLVGDVEFSADNGGRTAVVASCSKNKDGSSNLSFDVVPNTGLSTLSNTGIRVVHILRQPGSLFNVIERNGNPYVFLTKNGLMSKKSLIDRTAICAQAQNKKADEDAVDKSKTEDCGNSSAGSSSVESKYCWPWGRRSKDLMEFLEAHDTYKIENPTCLNIQLGRSRYGYYEVPERNDFYKSTSMSVLFIEADFSVSFCAFNYSVMADVLCKYTENAWWLFDVPSSPVKFSIPIKHTAYLAFYDYFYSNRHGKLGYLDEERVVAICKEKGWYAGEQGAAYPDDVDWLEFTKELTDELRESGFSKQKHLYTVRARDFFEHFGCRNWEVSSSDFLGDEVRWLVGWGPRDASGCFSNDSSFSYETFTEEGTDEKIIVPKWIVARIVWWKKYSKRGNEVRHFIVPKERGLVIYTGSFTNDDEKHAVKIRAREASPTSWDCGVSPPWITIGQAQYSISQNMYLNRDRIREHLYKEYESGYSPTSDEERSIPLFDGDNVVFLKFDWCSLSNVEVRIPFEQLERKALYYPNRVTSDTLVVQPTDAPIYVENADENYGTWSGWLGPFEYEYDKLYIPGQGYPQDGDDDWKEAEAIKAPIAFQFDINKTSANCFNLDTTDLIANGISYQNPIHIKASESVQSPATIDISDPTDSSEVSDKLSKLVTGQTTGNGIEISIPGLQ